LLQYAPPRDVYERPATRFVADFIGATSFLPATVVTAGGASVEVRLASGTLLRAAADGGSWQPGQAVNLAVRAERVEPVGPGTPDGNVVAATLRTALYLGASHQYVLDTADGPLRLDTPDELPPGQL